MKILITYFYMVRFLKPHQIPMSTADWDPRWFHDFRGQEHIWKDKNGVWNGVRLEILNPSHCCSILPPECVKCSKQIKVRHPESCSFLRDYKEGLYKLDFNELMEYLTRTANYFQQLEGFTDEPEIMLVVHESPDNPCSERVPLIELFKSHNIELKEFEKDD